MAASFLALCMLDEISRRSLRRQRVFRDRTNAFELPHDAFISLFRLSKELVVELCDHLREDLQPRAVQRTALSVEQKVLIALRFFAVGCYQRAVGQDVTLAVTQRTVSGCLLSVTSAIIKVLLNAKVKFPRDVGSQIPIKLGFFNLAKFPGVIGAIDCTHIAIIAPKEKEEQYVNRKGYHSLNVQLVCDADMKILNVNSNFPGSTHDSYIWKVSALRRALVQDYEKGGRNAWLLGDSGYPLEPWLLTPFLNPPANSPSLKYNMAHSKARNIVERCIGVMKQRFRCLLRHRTLHYSPTRAANMVIACCVLHNMCVEARLPAPADDDVPLEAEDSLSVTVVSQQDTSQAGVAQRIREEIVHMRFSH